ncbi:MULTISPECIES: hypothetical protein [Nonomuraea]|jgi:hypothetical protein|uniref:Uncharacterized protein n=1 Tax=Nonomuraea salmonea TaxID=46181 RepID=A0ABV5NCA7_9ACTN
MRRLSRTVVAVAGDGAADVVAGLGGLPKVVPDQLLTGSTPS